MWNWTRRLAESIGKGINEKDDKVTVKLYNIARRDLNDVVTEVFKSKSSVHG